MMMLHVGQQATGNVLPEQCRSGNALYIIKAKNAVSERIKGLKLIDGVYQ